MAAIWLCLFLLSLGKDRAMEGKLDWSELGPKRAEQSSLWLIDPPLGISVAVLIDSLA